MFGFGEGSIQFAPLPQTFEFNTDVRDRRALVAAVYENVQVARNLRVNAGFPSNKKIPLIIDTSDARVEAEFPTIARLANAESVRNRKSVAVAPTGPTGATGSGQVTVEATIDKEVERERLEKEIAKLETELSAAEAKLKNKSFVERAPAAVVEEHRQRQKNFGEQLAKLKQARDQL